MGNERSVRKYLDVCTGNLPREEMDAIDNGEAGIARPYEYGAWVWVPDDGADAEVREHQPRLAAIIDEARRLGCDWVNFDRDADLLVGFPAFEW